MSVAEVREKCKNLIRGVPRDVLIIAVLILASSMSFGLGYLTGTEAGRGSGISIVEQALPPETPVLPLSAASAAGQVVASKNGTKYYLPECAGASRIAAANKVSFASVAAAQAAGYSPAANCKGL